MRTDPLGLDPSLSRPKPVAHTPRRERADVDTRRKPRRDEDTVDFTYVDGAYEPRADVSDTDLSNDEREPDAGLQAPLAASFNGPKLYTRNASITSIVASTGPRRIDVYA